jgi:hypothetical protein
VKDWCSIKKIIDVLHRLTCEELLIHHALGRYPVDMQAPWV